MWLRDQLLPTLCHTYQSFQARCGMANSSMRSLHREAFAVHSMSLGTRNTIVVSPPPSENDLGTLLMYKAE